MAKYLIVLKEKINVDFLEYYNASNIEVHMGLIVFAHMSEEDANRLKENEYIDSIEQDGEDITDGEVYLESQLSYPFKLMNIEKFHSEGFKGKGFKVGILDTGFKNMLI